MIKQEINFTSMQRHKQNTDVDIKSGKWQK